MFRETRKHKKTQETWELKCRFADVSVFEPDTKAIPLSRAAENLLHRNNILSLLSGDEKLSGTPIDAVPGGTGV